VIEFSFFNLFSFGFRTKSHGLQMSKICLWSIVICTQMPADVSAAIPVTTALHNRTCNFGVDMRQSDWFVLPICFVIQSPIQ
jgi:hypothetical protein